MRVISSLGVVCAMSVLLACSAQSDSQRPLPLVPYTEIASGMNPISGVVENRKIEVFRDQSSLDSRWAYYVQPAPQTSIDFTRHQVVLINLGLHRAGLDIPKVVAARDHESFIELITVLIQAGPRCVVPQVFTSPFLFIKLESNKDIVFVEQFQLRDCP